MKQKKKNLENELKQWQDQMGEHSSLHAMLQGSVDVSSLQVQELLEKQRMYQNERQQLETAAKNASNEKKKILQDKQKIKQENKKLKDDLKNAQQNMHQQVKDLQQQHAAKVKELQDQQRVAEQAAERAAKQAAAETKETKTKVQTEQHRADAEQRRAVELNTKLQNLMQEQKDNEAATLTIKHTFEIKLTELKNKQNPEDENSMNQHTQALDALRSKLLKDHIEEKDNLKKEYMKKKNVLENLQKKERKRNNMQHNEQEKLHAQQDKDLQHQLDEMSNKNDDLNASLSKSKHDVDVLKKEMHNRIFTMEEQYQKEAIDATNKINELKAQHKREKKPVQFNVQVEKENKTSSISNKCTHDNCQCTDRNCLVRAPTLQASSSTSSTEWYWKPCCWFSFVLVLLLGYLFNQERNFTKNNSTKFDSTNQNWDVKLKTLKSSHARALTSCETNSKTQVVSLNAKLKEHQQSIATINKQCTINIEKMKTEKNCEISETKIIQGLQNSCDKETTALENQLKTKQSDLVAIQKSNDAAVAKAIAATNKECLAKMNVAATKLNKEHLVQQKAS